MRYVFDREREGSVFISPDRLYGVVSSDSTDQRERVSAGFLTEENRKKSGRLQIPELNSGFDTIWWYRNQTVSRIRADENGCYVQWEGQGDIPLTFVSDVKEEGNYEVEITLTAIEGSPVCLIFLGRRRLAYLGPAAAGTRFTGKFITNICPIIPRGHSEVMEDLTLDVTIIGRGVRLTKVSVEPWSGKTLYIAGDSTVTDQSADYPYLPGSSYSGWGQMLSCYLGRHMAVSNHAHSGLTTESFRSEGHYDILHTRLKKGDICLFQFGHNDQKLMELKAEGGYRRNLVRYIEEVQDKGALPILVTPLARNTWRGDDGSYNDLLEEYALVCQSLAEEYKIPLADLHSMSKDMVLKLGRESAKRYFYPSDYTHSNDYGAYCFAGFVYEELCRAGIAEHEEATEWQPPEKMERLSVPEGLSDEKNPDEEILFADLKRPGDELTRAEALEMVIAAMHFFPTNVYNDMFEDVIGHELYAGTVECAWQNGLIPSGMIRDRKFYPNEKITGGEFINVLLNGYKSRKPLPETEETVPDGQEGWMAPLIKAAKKLMILPKEFRAEEHLTRETAADICRKLHI